MSLILRGFGVASVLLSTGLLWTGSKTRDERANLLLAAGVVMLILGVAVATGLLPLKIGALYFYSPE